MTQDGNTSLATTHPATALFSRCDHGEFSRQSDRLIRCVNQCAARRVNLDCARAARGSRFADIMADLRLTQTGVRAINGLAGTRSAGTGAGGIDSSPGREINDWARGIKPADFRLI